MPGTKKKRDFRAITIIAILLIAGVWAYWNFSQTGTQKEVQLGSPTGKVPGAFPLYRFYNGVTGDHLFSAFRFKVASATENIVDSKSYLICGDSGSGINICQKGSTADTCGGCAASATVGVGGGILDTGYVYEGIAGYIPDWMGCSGKSDNRLFEYVTKGPYSGYCSGEGDSCTIGNHYTSSGWENQIYRAVGCMYPAANCPETESVYLLNRGNDYVVAIGQKTKEFTDQGYALDEKLGCGSVICGDGVCGTGETSANCGSDCGGGTGGAVLTQINGYHDSSSCDAISGWACEDRDSYLRIDIYSVEAGNRGVGSTTANLPREPLVGVNCGGNPNHGFSLPTPDWLKDNQVHTIRLAAISSADSNVAKWLDGSQGDLSYTLGPCAGGVPGDCSEANSGAYKCVGDSYQQCGQTGGVWAWGTAKVCTGCTIDASGQPHCTNAGCGIGQELCSDGVCRPEGTCTALPACNGNGVCDSGEGCSCSDCLNQTDSCQTGLVCTAVDGCGCPSGQIYSSGKCIDVTNLPCRNNNDCPAGSGQFCNPATGYCECPSGKAMCRNSGMAGVCKSNLADCCAGTQAYCNNACIASCSQCGQCPNNGYRNHLLMCFANQTDCAGAFAPSLFWKFEDSGLTISTAKVGQTPRMVFESSGLTSNSAVSFEIFRVNSTNGIENIRSGAANMTNSSHGAGRAGADWALTSEEIDHLKSVVKEGTVAKDNIMFRVRVGGNLLSQNSNPLAVLLSTSPHTVTLNKCGDYTVRSDCQGTAPRAQRDVMKEWANCGSNGQNCVCRWNDASGKCEFYGPMILPNLPGTPTTPGPCSVDVEYTGACVNGVRQVNSVVSGAGCPASGPTELPCGIVVAEMPFFGMIEFFLAMAAMTLIYFIIFSGKKEANF